MTVNNRLQLQEFKIILWELKSIFKEECDKIVKGLEETCGMLVLFKKEKNSSMIVLGEGKITAVDPNNMPPTTLFKRIAGLTTKIEHFLTY